MDYLLIQASSVPCERVFSSSAETDTKKQNRIKPELMEALQVLKFALKQEHLDFSGYLLTYDCTFAHWEPPRTNSLDENAQHESLGTEVLLGQ